MSRTRSDPYGFRRERKDLLRAVAGGSIVGMPLLYTMEMWYQGATLSPWHQLAVLGAILVVNFGFCLVSGFRHDRGVGEAVMEAFTSVGIALLYSTAILWLIGTIAPQTSLAESIGKILLEASAVSLGVSFAEAHFRGKSRTGDEENAIDDSARHKNASEEPAPSPDQLERMQLHADLVDVGATVVGSTIFALNIAPTEEVLLIAARLGPVQLLALLAATVALCYVILYASGFENQPVHVQGVFQSAWAETLMTVAVSLLAGLGLMLLIGQPEIMSDHAPIVAATVVLGLPATVGGAAGRLIT
jgi:putative integral membrane protein (TIGR02587 family)